MGDAFFLAYDGQRVGTTIARPVARPANEAAASYALVLNELSLKRTGWGEKIRNSLYPKISGRSPKGSADGRLVVAG